MCFCELMSQFGFPCVQKRKIYDFQVSVLAVKQFSWSPAYKLCTVYPAMLGNDDIWALGQLNLICLIWQMITSGHTGLIIGHNVRWTEWYWEQKGYGQRLSRWTLAGLCLAHSCFWVCMLGNYCHMPCQRKLVCRNVFNHKTTCKCWDYVVMDTGPVK